MIAWHRFGLIAATLVATTALVQAAAADIAVGRMAQSAQPCDPLIDGTYCASQGGSVDYGASSGKGGMTGIQSLSGDLSIGSDPPGTLAGITFGGGNSICIGVIRREACN